MTLTRLKFNSSVQFVTSARGAAYRTHIIDQANSQLRWVMGRPDLTEYRIRKFCRWDLPMSPKWELHSEPPPGFPMCVACEREHEWFLEHGSRRLWVQNNAGKSHLQSVGVRRNINPPF